ATVVAGLATASRNVTAQKGAQKPAVKNFEDFDPTSFGASTSTHIDNPWMPLTPGTRFIFDGRTVEDRGKTVAHRIVMNVTDLAKVIGGIRSLVTWDLDYSDGQLVEADLAFYAQDKEGTVWRMGEYTEEYEKRRFVAASPWLHGIASARA